MKKKYDNEVLNMIQEKWDVVYPGLRLDVKEDSGNYFIGWKVLNPKIKTIGKKRRIPKDSLEGRYIQIDLLKLEIDLIEHDFKEWAITQVLLGKYIAED